MNCDVAARQDRLGLRFAVALFVREFAQPDAGDVALGLRPPAYAPLFLRRKRVLAWRQGPDRARRETFGVGIVAADIAPGDGPGDGSSVGLGIIGDDEQASRTDRVAELEARHRGRYLAHDVLERIADLAAGQLALEPVEADRHEIDVGCAVPL